MHGMHKVFIYRRYSILGILESSLHAPDSCSSPAVYEVRRSTFSSTMVSQLVL